MCLGVDLWTEPKHEDDRAGALATSERRPRGRGSHASNDGNTRAIELEPSVVVGERRKGRDWLGGREQAEVEGRLLWIKVRCPEIPAVETVGHGDVFDAIRAQMASNTSP